MLIETIIPHEPGNKLGEAYNRAIEKADNWVLILDRDVLILNPHWYDICLNAIDKVGDQAGFISCLTNLSGCHWQRHNDIDKDNHDIKYHLSISEKLWTERKFAYYEPDNYGSFSGHFILTNKKAWEKVGKFKSGMPVDNDYCEKIRKAGYKRYIMVGLYVYHMHSMKGVYFK